MASVQEGDLLWEPSSEVIENANLTDFMRWLDDNHSLQFNDYADLWEWSVTEIGDFWQAIWDYAGVVASTPGTAALGDKSMPGTEWFPGATLN